MRSTRFLLSSAAAAAVLMLGFGGVSTTAGAAPNAAQNANSQCKKGMLSCSTTVRSPGSKAPSNAAPDCTPGTTVRTDNGKVCGITKNGVTNYYGIPFAAAPVGELRWQPPQPADDWRGTLQATAPAAPCTQPGRGGMAGTEDCLNVEVQVPAGTDSDANLPVMVRIHGGGFLVTAFGHLPQSDKLVNRGVIVVAVNYRTGIMGFFAAKALGPHSGNYGIQDQQAALRWVQENIAEFGGNPDNVTIFGTSAGGASVCINAMAPGSAGLFQRGISRSGFYNAAVGRDKVWQLADCKSELPSEAEAQAAGARFVAKMGCADAEDVAQCMRQLPASKLVTGASAAIAAAKQNKLSPKSGPTIAPIVDGKTIPMSPAKAFAEGHVNDVSLIIGADRDEINGGSGGPNVAARTPEAYKKLLKQKYGSLADRIMQLYPLENYGKPSAFIAFRTIVADADSVCPALRTFRNLSKYMPVYAYQVNDSDAPVVYLGSKLPWGAYHGSGGAMTILPPRNGLSANQTVLYNTVARQYIGFATNGNPSPPHTPPWPQYTAEHPEVMLLQAAGTSHTVPASIIARTHHCAFWDAVTPFPRH